MATLAQLQDRLDRLRRARASGVKSLEDARGSRTEYKSDQEMAAAEQSLLDQIAALDPSAGAAAISYASHSAD